MKKNFKGNYVSPELNVAVFAVERGFAASGKVKSSSGFGYENEGEL